MQNHTTLQNQWVKIIYIDSDLKCFVQDELLNHKKIQRCKYIS